MTVRRVHRLLGLSVAALWLVQILTGVLLTFRLEIDNWLVGGMAAPLQVEAMQQRIRSIEAAGGAVSSVWVTNFAVTRFDVLYSDSAHHERKMRVDGSGRILRDGLDGAKFANGGYLDTLTDIHTRLLAGEAGRWIIAVSGVLLLTNLMLGLKLAWPRRGSWKQSFVVRISRNARANLYGLHRTLGLYIAFPLLVLVCAGIALCFDDELETALQVVRDPPVASAPAPGAVIGPARALQIALDRYPGATFTALSMPAEATPWYRVRLHALGEINRMYGRTTVYLGATDGQVLKEYAAASAPPVRRVLDWVYPIHTAEAGGVIARVLLVCIGLALLTLGYLGIRLWSRR